MKRDKANNAKPFEFHTNDGVIFTSPRSDFQGGINVKGLPVNVQTDENLNRLMVAVAEMVAYHRGEVWPTLNGFSGYDCLRFEEEDDSEGTEGQDRESYSDDQDRENYEPHSVKSNLDEKNCRSKKASELKKGDFIVIWRKHKKCPAEILGKDKKGRILYRVPEEGAEFSAKIDPIQIVRVFAREEDAKQDALQSLELHWSGGE